MANSISAGKSDFSEMDNAGISKEHWKIMFISGMGFFTDAYDLFIIGVVMSLLKSEWHVTPAQDGLVTSTALLASAIGALLFGRIADMLGRKRIYGYEVLVLAAGMHELLILQRAPQTGFDRQLLRDAGIHLRLVEQRARLRCFGIAQRGLGIAQQGIGIAAVRREHGNAGAHRNMDGLVA